MGISILNFLYVHQCVLQTKICVLLSSVTTITITNGKIRINWDKKCTYNTPPRTSESHWQWHLILTRGPINSQEGSNLPVHSWFNFGRHHFLWNVYIKTKGRLLKIFNSIKYLTLGYIMAKNMNYDIYKPQIIFHPLLSVHYYFFEFSHCFYFHTARIVLYYLNFIWEKLLTQEWFCCLYIYHSLADCGCDWFLVLVCSATWGLAWWPTRFWEIYVWISHIFQKMRKKF